MFKFINPNELEKIEINLNGNISEQIEENLYPKSQNDYKQLYTEIWDNMISVLYMDENGQIWKKVYPNYPNENMFEYIAKAKL